MFTGLNSVRLDLCCEVVTECLGMRQLIVQYGQVVFVYVYYIYYLYIYIYIIAQPGGQYGEIFVLVVGSS